MSNTFGRLFRLTSFGESHGPALGGVVDGMPAGIAVNLEEVQAALDRRRPGQSSLTTSRSEADRVEILSGLYNGVTTGTPIGFLVRNTDHRSTDYEQNATLLRPSHADWTYELKYGIRDPRGGGRSSARETVSRVVAGALAMQALRTLGVEIHAYTSQVGPIIMSGSYVDYDLSRTDDNAVRCPDPVTAARMESYIADVKAAGDTVGGVVTCVISNPPAGLGEPVFGKLNARLADAMLSINAAKGFDIGLGFDGCGCMGSEVSDRLLPGDGGPCLASNHSGGIQGGISNGSDIWMRIAFKPVATMMRTVETTDKDGRPGILQPRGRHDACVLPRAVPIVEAMAAITMLDAYLISKTTRL